MSQLDSIWLIRFDYNIELTTVHLDIELQKEFKQRKARAPHGEPPSPELGVCTICE